MVTGASPVHPQTPLRGKHTPGAGLRHWLTGLLAGLLALAILPVPAQHLRMSVERTAFVAAHAMHHGAVPELGSGHHGSSDGHSQHPSMPDCFACVLMASPGLTAPSFQLGARIVAPIAAQLGGEGAVAAQAVAWPPQRARAPPAGSIA